MTHILHLSMLFLLVFALGIAFIFDCWCLSKMYRCSLPPCAAVSDISVPFDFFFSIKQRADHLLPLSCLNYSLLKSLQVPCWMPFSLPLALVLSCKLQQVPQVLSVVTQPMPKLWGGEKGPSCALQFWSGWDPDCLLLFQNVILWKTSWRGWQHS